MTDPTIAKLGQGYDEQTAATIAYLEAINAESLAYLVPALEEYRDQTLAVLAYLDSEGEVRAAEVA